MGFNFFDPIGVFDNSSSLSSFASNPGVFVNNKIFGEGDVSDWMTTLFDPGSAAIRNVSMAAEEGNWGNPFSSEASGWDYLGGGPQAENPSNRRIGRTVGGAFAGYGLGAAAGAYGGGAAGGTAGSTTTAFAPAAEGGFYAGTEGWPAWATEGGGMYGGGAGATAGSSYIPSVFNPNEDVGAYDYSYDDPTFFPSGSDFSIFTNTPTFGGGGGGGPSFAPGEQGGMPRSVWEDMMRRNRRMPLLDIASGIYGLTQARGIRREAQRADPMSAYRGQYAAQLAQLAANPNMITSMPGYAAGQQAIERRLASQGYLGSGNMMLAMGNYGGDFYNREIARLNALATPSPGAIESRVAGRRASADLTGRSLASIGRGIYNW